MADISIQCYSKPDELANFLTEWVHLHCVHIVAVEFRPFAAKIISVSKILECVLDPQVRRVHISAIPPILSASTKSDFDRGNGTSLVLDIGKIGEHGLGESWLASRTDDKDSLVKWRQIAKSLKEKTQAGITATNRTNGISEYYPSHRYTQGALDLKNSGVAIVSVQGIAGPVIQLGDVREPDTLRQ